MQDILSQEILLKNYTKLQLFIFLATIIVLPLLINLNVDSTIITGLEQSLFVVLSAILFVFNDSVVGYETVSKIKNTLDKLSQKEIKSKVLVAIGSDNSIAYEEFLEQTKGQITKFNKVIYKFKKKSYQFYLFFSFLGLLALFLVLIEKDSIVLTITVNLLKQSTTSIDAYKILLYTKSYIIDFSIITQFILIIIWIISAIQAEKQKTDLLNYLDGARAIENVKKYIENKNNIDISKAFETIEELDND